MRFINNMSSKEYVVFFFFSLESPIFPNKIYLILFIFNLSSSASFANKIVSILLIFRDWMIGNFFLYCLLIKIFVLPTAPAHCTKIDCSIMLQVSDFYGASKSFESLISSDVWPDIRHIYIYYEVPRCAVPCGNSSR